VFKLFFELGTSMIILNSHFLQEAFGCLPFEEATGFFSFFDYSLLITNH
jgi:hypothetical protein